MHVYICEYSSYINMYTYFRVYIYTKTCLYVYTYICIHIYVYIYMYICIPLYVYTYMYTYMSIKIFIYVYKFFITYMYKNIHVSERLVFIYVIVFVNVCVHILFISINMYLCQHFMRIRKYSDDAHELSPPHCNTLQHTATTHCNTLQHTATHCNTLQHTATHCNTHSPHFCEFLFFQR